MSSRPAPFGPDTLPIDAYLASDDGEGDEALARWKQEHPDWFVAGTWRRAGPAKRSA